MSQSAMISHDRQEGRFNLRAGAIIVRDGRLLIHRATIDDYWSLPGGRIEWGEASSETLAREMVEELGVAGTVTGLAAVIENFFALDGVPCHEVATYHWVTLDDGFAFPGDEAVCHRCRDGASDLEFRWVPVVKDRLEAYRLMPAVLRGVLPTLGDGPVHLVCREGRA